MPVTKFRRAAPETPRPNDMWTPGDATQLEALASACAMVASADGWVTAEERRGARERMGRLDAVRIFGVEDALASFEAIADRMERDPSDARAEAEKAVRRMRGRRGPSLLLLDAACGVAMADGGFDAGERDVILRLCRLLDVEPSQLGMVAAEGTS